VTKSEKEYLDRVARIGCIVCRKNGYHSPATIHHLREGMGMGMRNDYKHAIPLCPYHHQDGPIGEAIHKGIKSFAKNHGTEKQLLGQVIAMLAVEERK
jgi:hypothetical protein